MTQINAYLNFDGNCREAMYFYKDCLGGELSLQTVEGSRIEAECPDAIRHHILHASLLSDGFALMGSDMKGPDGFIRGNTIALCINCSSEGEIHSFFERLSRDGTVSHELRKEFRGATFGVLTDKFGIRWMLHYDEQKA